MTDDVRIFYFQPKSKQVAWQLYKVILILDQFSLKYEGRSNWPPPKIFTLKKSSHVRVNKKAELWKCSIGIFSQFFQYPSALTKNDLSVSNWSWKFIFKISQSFQALRVFFSDRLKYFCDYFWCKYKLQSDKLKQQPL